MSDGKLKYEERHSATAKTMEARIRTSEVHEKAAIELTQRELYRITEARKVIFNLQKERAIKEDIIERLGFKYRTLEQRLEIVEAKIKSSRDIRMEQFLLEKQMQVQSLIDSSLEKQTALHKKVMEGMRATEKLEKHLHCACDKGVRLRDRMASSIEELRYHLDRQEELKKSIRDKLSNIKKMHGEVFALEPKIKESYARAQKSELTASILRSKIKKSEEEIKQLQAGTIRMKEEIERATIECGVKQRRNVKKPEVIPAVKKFIEGDLKQQRNVKKREIVAALAKFIEIYSMR